MADRTNLPSSSRRGRPRKGRRQADESARRRLLTAAAEQFAARGFAATSLRQVAREADVTPAMVSYYFKDKSGLLEAVLVEGLELLLGELERAVTEARAHGDVLARFVRAYLGTLTRYPWVPRIVVQEVISRDTPLREVFIERFANRALSLVAPLLREEIEAGRLRTDLDARMTVMSVLGMCVFPYIAEPLLGRLLDYRIDETFAAAFIPHTVEVLRHGLEGQS